MRNKLIHDFFKLTFYIGNRNMHSVTISTLPITVLKLQCAHCHRSVEWSWKQSWYGVPFGYRTFKIINDNTSQSCKQIWIIPLGRPFSVKVQEPDPIHLKAIVRSSLITKGSSFKECSIDITIENKLLK